MQKKIHEWTNKWMRPESTDEIIDDRNCRRLLNHANQQLQLPVTAVTRKSTVTTVVGWSIQRAKMMSQDICLIGFPEFATSLNVKHVHRVNSYCKAHGSTHSFSNLPELTASERIQYCRENPYTNQIDWILIKMHKED